jgi:hypothetical protein
MYTLCMYGHKITDSSNREIPQDDPRETAAPFVEPFFTTATDLKLLCTSRTRGTLQIICKLSELLYSD